MASNPAIQLASTIQSASVNRSPSPTHDINPSTAASRRTPVTLTSTTSDPPRTSSSSPDDAASLPSYIEVQEVPRNAGRHPYGRHGRQTLPPLPDLRFEQSYLKSIQGKEDDWKAVAWITTRDQVVLPLVQGLVWSLVLAGWRTWNRGARFSGEGVGAKVRRWWWGVNGWALPDEHRQRKMASEAADFFSQ